MNRVKSRLVSDSKKIEAATSYDDSAFMTAAGFHFIQCYCYGEKNGDVQSFIEDGMSNCSESDITEEEWIEYCKKIYPKNIDEAFRYVGSKLYSMIEEYSDNYI